MSEQVSHLHVPCFPSHWYGAHSPPTNARHVRFRCVGTATTLCNSLRNTRTASPHPKRVGCVCARQVTRATDVGTQQKPPDPAHPETWLTLVRIEAAPPRCRGSSQLTAQTAYFVLCGTFRLWQAILNIWFAFEANFQESQHGFNHGRLVSGHRFACFQTSRVLISSPRSFGEILPVDDVRCIPVLPAS